MRTAQQTQARGYCALGSVKPNIGHSNIAAGVAGFIKTVMAVREGVIPPLANYEHANPELDLPQTPFRIPTTLEPWPSRLDRPRRAGISSFGIGGTNCHIVIEGRPAEPRADNAIETPVVLPISVKKPQDLRALAGALSGAVRETPHPPLSDIAATLQSGRTEFPYRIAVAARTGKEASLGLLTRAGNLPTQPAGKLTKGRIVFVIPGHGSQYVAMGAGLYTAHPTFRRHFDDCAKAFDRAGHELRPPKIGEVSVSDPVALQSAIFSLGFALCRTLMDWGVKPSAVCGHSLGEYAAATIAGVLTLDDAACLVVARAQGTAVAEPGGMLSLAAPETVARQLIGDVRGLSLAALNSPNDTVVSGADDSITAAELWCERNTVAARRLPVRHAFHSPMMSTAGERLEEAAAGVSMRPPTIPLVSNLTGRLWTADETADPDYWIKQLLSPVRFSAGISALTSSEPSTLLEAGPGRTLQRALVRSAAVTATKDARSPVVCALGSARGDATLEPFALAETIAELWQSGTDIDWEKYREGAPFRRVALPAYPFARMKCWPADDLAQRATSSAVPPPPEGRLKWEDIFHLPSWARTPAPTSSVHGWQGEFIVLAPRDGRGGQFADSLCTILEAKTSRVVRIDAGPEPHAHHLAMSGALPRIRDSEGQVRLIDLTCLGCEVRTSTNAIDMTNMLSNGFARLAEITGGKQVETWLILDGALQVMDEDCQPLVAPLLGPVITAAQEHPQIATRLIDVRLGTVGSTGDEKQLAAQIAAEVSSVAPRSEPLLALRGGHGWVERFESLPICQADRQAGAERLQRAGGPHIITGGLGRIGRELARRLANLGCQVVLVSRKPAPHPDWLNENFADASARVEIRKCDVSNERDVRQLLFSLAASHGGIGGIFHAAGVADLRYLEQTSSETIAAECAPKIAGLENLCKAIEDLGAQTGRRPDFAMLFSSMAAVLGGLGMTGYMAANRYMDARVAKTPSIAGVPLVSVNFDDWDFDYSKEQVAAYAHTRKGLSLSPEEGLAAIEAILGQPTLHQVVLSATPIEQRIAKWMKRQPGIGGPAAHKTPPPSAAKVLENLEKQLIGGDPIADLVLKAYAKVIGAVGLAPDADFFELGGDSLLAAQLALELRKSMPQDTNLTIGDIFDHPTPLQLAARLAECSNGGIPDKHDFATIN
jgi:acyl transferase domain-containing protein